MGVFLMHTDYIQDNAGSIFTALEKVMLQVDYHCFSNLRLDWVDPLYKELCLIIAEVLVLPNDFPMKINGTLIGAKLVQDVFLQIRNHHVQLVFDNFKNVSYPVRNKKAYLRTVLYNAFFECESHYSNLYAMDHLKIF
jgi:hypothetical protein